MNATQKHVLGVVHNDMLEYSGFVASVAKDTAISPESAALLDRAVKAIEEAVNALSQSARSV